MTVWSFSGREAGNQTSRPDDLSSSESSPYNGEQEVPDDIRQDQVELDRLVRKFAPLYFSLPPDPNLEEVKRQIKPLVTDSFLESAQFGFGSSEADLAMIREGASLEVKALTGLVGLFLDDDTARGSVRLRITKFDRDGSVVISFSSDQLITVIRQDDAWMIDSVPRT